MNQSLQKATIESLHSKNERIKKMRKLNLFCLIIFALIFITLGCAKAQRGNVVTEEGMAKIIQGDVEAATAAAERVALCKAVARKIGIGIDSVRVTDNAEALINIIRTHITGHAKTLETIEKWTDRDNYRHVKIQAWVSPKISEEEMKKLEPATLLFLLDTEVKNRTEEEVNIDFSKEMGNEIRGMLTQEGYHIPLLTDKLAKELKVLLSNQTPTGIDNWYLSELSGAAGIFIMGESNLILRIGDTPGFKSTMYAAECDTNLKILPNNEPISPQTISYESSFYEKGIHKRIRQSIRYAIDDTIKSIQNSKYPNFLEKLEEITGPPNRIIYLYVKGLSSANEYNELQNYLRKKLSVFDVEEVRGVRFDTQTDEENVSKIILTFSNQIESDFAGVVEHIAQTVDNSPDYSLLYKRLSTIIVQKGVE